MKPSELRPGQRIVHTVPNMNGTITVYLTSCNGDRVHVDVLVSDQSAHWDANDLLAGTGAVDFHLAGVTPALRWRLIFLPDTDVEVEP